MANYLVVLLTASLTFELVLSQAVISQTENNESSENLQFRDQLIMDLDVVKMNEVVDKIEHLKVNHFARWDIIKDIFQLLGFKTRSSQVELSEEYNDNFDTNRKNSNPKDITLAKAIIKIGVIKRNLVEHYNIVRETMHQFFTFMNFKLDSDPFSDNNWEKELDMIRNEDEDKDILYYIEKKVACMERYQLENWKSINVAMYKFFDFMGFKVNLSEAELQEVPYTGNFIVGSLEHIIERLNRFEIHQVHRWNTVQKILAQFFEFMNYTPNDIVLAKLGRRETVGNIVYVHDKLDQLRKNQREHWDLLVCELKKFFIFLGFKPKLNHLPGMSNEKFLNKKLLVLGPVVQRYYKSNRKL